MLYAVQSYDPIAQDFFDALQPFGGLSLRQRAAVDTRARQIRNRLGWQRIICDRPLIGGDFNRHKFNLKDPSVYTATQFGGVTNNSLGVQSDGLTGYWDTGINFNPLGHNNIALTFYTQNNLAQNTSDFGCSNGVQAYRHRIRIAANNYQVQMGGTASVQIAVPTGIGFFGTTRINSSQIVQQYGTTQATVAHNFSANPNLNNYFMCRNLILVPDNFSTRIYSSHTLAYDWTANDLMIMQQIEQQFQTTSGRPQ